MRYGILLALALTALLSGCGTLTSMEELERQAMITGDWSDVERRERILARRDARSGPQCPDGQIAFCETSASVNRCECIAPSVMRSSFSQL
jgi:hypothetical protein